MNVSARCAAIAVVCISLRAHAQVSASGVAELVNASTLSRSAYVAAVLRLNPSIASARESWRAARSRARQAGALDDPMIEGSIAPLSLAGDARFGFEVGIQQTLPWFGKRELEGKAMDSEAAASGSDLDSARRELALQAVVLYTQYYVALQSLEINARHAELLQAARELAIAQVEAGRGGVPDVLQAEVESAQLERSSLELATERDLVIAQMNQLLNRDPAAALPPPPSSLEIESLPQPQDTRQLAAEALRTRSEIAGARLQAQAQSLKADAAGRDYFPSLTLSTSYNSMWDMTQHRWMLGVGLNLPLPNARRAAAIDEARANQARFQSDIARMTAAVQTEVFIGLRRLGESQQLLVLFQDRLLPLARERLDAAQAGLAASRSTLAAVIDAQRGLRSVELEQQLAQAEHIRRDAELARALGRVPGVDDSRGQP